jgi:hypothetical protein
MGVETECVNSIDPLDTTYLSSYLHQRQEQRTPRYLSTAAGRQPLPMDPCSAYRAGTSQPVRRPINGHVTVRRGLAPCSINRCSLYPEASTFHQCSRQCRGEHCALHGTSTQDSGETDSGFHSSWDDTRKLSDAAICHENLWVL